MSDVLAIEYRIDLDELREQIQQASNLEASDAMTRLVVVQLTASAIKEHLARLDTVLGEAKGLIDNKAKALIGADWAVIKGDGYKITKSSTGSMYTLNGKPAKEFVKVKTEIDSKAVTDHVKTTGKLPKGIEYNPLRGSSITIRASSHEDSEA